VAAGRLSDQFASAALHSPGSIQLGLPVEEALVPRRVSVELRREIGIEAQEHLFGIKRECQDVPRPGAQSGDAFRAQRWGPAKDEYGNARRREPVAPELTAELRGVPAPRSVAREHDDVGRGAARELERLRGRGRAEEFVALGLKDALQSVSGPAVGTDN
jgi:hypothetical protein